MTTTTAHDQFVTAAQKRIKNPSPAVRAYLENYRKNIPAYLSHDEQQLLININKSK